MLGMFNAVVAYEGNQKKLPLLVVKGTQPCLLGRDWLNEIHINWHVLKFVQKDLDKLLQKYSKVFQEGLGKITGVKARIEVHTDAKPRYFKPRPVPYALRNKIEAELERLQ